ncbi:MAG: biotin--[acetyl-CoA-carboxylase] ligase [Candidatus Sumerlaeia bacterium]|nr:biotin--[acetyl-CoA-carboxylase] ligase [Candidatus Sumerlaeia bacterium]
MAAERDSLDYKALQKQLAELTLGRPLYYFARVDSTNQFLRSLPPHQWRHGALALADHQTAGRGRHGRRWNDRPGMALLFSLALDAARPPAVWPLLTLGAAVSVCRVLEGQGLAGVKIRWPNDILVGERKVCGILVEKAKVRSGLVLGVGLNVHQTLDDFPPAIRAHAGSLRLCSERPFRRSDLLVAFLKDFEKVFCLWQESEDTPLLDECRARMATLGRLVHLHCHGRLVEGVVMDLDRDGSLVLREPTGIVSRWHSGEVELAKWTED